MNDLAIALVRKLNVTPENNRTRNALTQAVDATINLQSSPAPRSHGHVDGGVASQKTVNEEQDAYC
jgi:hypothetical protein